MKNIITSPRLLTPWSERGRCFDLKVFFVLIWLLFFILFNVAKAAELSEVYISEIAWMGGFESGNDEWIEICNSSDGEVDLVGWILRARDGSPEIELEGSVGAGSCYLMERTDDESVIEIEADLIYSGALGNSGEDLKLVDSFGKVVDEVLFGEEWLYGSNEEKLSMERVVGGWRNSSEAGGSPGVVNFVNEVEVVDPSFAEASEGRFLGGENKSVKKKVKKVLVDLVMSELYIDPLGSDLEGEFVEIYNKEEKSVALFGWGLIDKSSKKYFFEKGDYIKGEGYFVVYRDVSDIALNNSGDEICLTKGSKKMNCVKFGKAKEGSSYNLSAEAKLLAGQEVKVGYELEENVSKWEWSEYVSPGEMNVIEVRNRLPVIEFTCPDEVFVFETIRCDASDSMDYETRELKYFWDFGDGFNNSLLRPEHTYKEVGEYEIMLEVCDERGCAVEKKVISVDSVGGPAGAEALAWQGREEEVEVVESECKDNDETCQGLSLHDYEESENSIGKDKSQEQENEASVFVFSDIGVEKRSVPLVGKLEEGMFGNGVEVEGVVVVLPGELGLQYFYIYSDELVQVYNYKKLFPEMKIGNQVRVRGEVSMGSGEYRLKTDDFDGIDVLENEFELVFEEVRCNDINQEMNNKLIRVEGVVVGKKSSEVYLDDGSGEVVISIKKYSGIDIKKVEAGETYNVSGLFIDKGKGLKLMPRFEDDFILLEGGFDVGDEVVAIGNEEVVLEEDSTSLVLGVSEGNKVFNIKERGDGLLWYLVVAIIFSCGVVGFFVYKNMVMRE